MSKIKLYLFFLVGSIGLLNSCSSTKNTSTATEATPSSNNTKSISTTEGSNNLTLVNYLRRVPGLQIDERGSEVSVMVRGMSSIGTTSQPLFVINNSPIGNSYQEAVNMVDVNDIKTVNVLMGPEGQQTYGIRGSNGVIQIITKSGSKPKK